MIDEKVLIERLEEFIETAKSEGDYTYIKPFEIVKDAVKDLAFEHNNGWAEKLIEAKKNCGEDSDCLECPFGQIEDRCILQELQFEKDDNDICLKCKHELEKIDREPCMNCTHLYNDMIAEYVKEKYPELLTTCDFAIFKIGVAARECVKGMCETLKQIDFSALKDYADRINDRRE